MTEIQEKLIFNTLSNHYGSIHLITDKFDIAYINHGGKILVQFCSGELSDSFEELVRGTTNSWVSVIDVWLEVRRIILNYKDSILCWHKEWCDGKHHRF